MTLLAHWPIDDGLDRPTPATARDVAAGGSGAHDGTYTWGTYSELWAGGYTPDSNRVGAFLYSHYAYIDSIANPADLRLLGEMTISGWFWVDFHAIANGFHEWDDGVRKFVTCGAADDASEATNDCFDLRNNARKVEFGWQFGAGQTQVTVQSADILPWIGPVHIAAVRYEVSVGFYGVKFYIDGVLVDTQDNTGSGWAGPTGGGSCLPRLLRDAAGINNRILMADSIRIYDTAENDAAILAIYNAELGDDTAILELRQNDVDAGQGGDGYSIVQNGPFSGRSDTGWVEL